MYKFLLFLHILSAIVGIGNYMLSGVRANSAMKQGGAANAAVAEAETQAGKVADLFIYAIFLTAIALILTGEGIEFSQMWISLSFLLYIAAVGISHGLMKPTARRARAAAGEGRIDELPALHQRLAISGTVLNVLGAVLLVLMIWQPGRP